MLSAALYVNDSISNLSAYAAYAEARLGGNGDPWGSPELVTGKVGEDPEYERITWDGDLEDGFDTGNVATAFGASITGQTIAGTYEVASQPLAFSKSFEGNIDKVQLRALTLTAASVTWSNICIQFYRNGQLVDDYASVSGFGVDETANTGSVEKEAILEVLAPDTDIDQVVVSGSYRMAYDSTQLFPWETDLMGQIYVYAN